LGKGKNAVTSKMRRGTGRGKGTTMDLRGRAKERGEVQSREAEKRLEMCMVATCERGGDGGK